MWRTLLPLLPRLPLYPRTRRLAPQELSQLKRCLSPLLQALAAVDASTEARRHGAGHWCENVEPLPAGRRPTWFAVCSPICDALQCNNPALPQSRHAKDVSESLLQ
jgi:hypothetical protein